MAKKTSYDLKNLTQVQRDCLGLIESLGIYELRALARVFGDNAPTTLKRNDHINIVMQKIISGEELQPIPLRQGRPYKELSNIEGILNKLSNLTGKDYTTKSLQLRTDTPHQKVVVFRQLQQEIVDKKMFPLEVRGVLRKKDDSNDLYFISQDNGKYVLVKEGTTLKPYDYITGTAVIMNEDREYLLDSIKSINFQPYSSYHEIEDEYDSALPEKTVTFEGKDLLLGTRYLVENKFLDNEAKIKDLVKVLRDNDVITLALIPNVMYENVLSLKSLGFNNCFVLKYDEKPLIMQETFSMVIEHVLRLQKLGMKVAVFLEDLPTFANSIDYACKSSGKTLMGHADTTVEIIKKFMMLAKAGVNGKHTTLFTTFDNADMFDQLYVSSIYKVSKKLN